jgi:hypothetical protein
VCTDAALDSCTNFKTSPDIDYGCGLAIDDKKNIYLAEQEGVRVCTPGLASCGTVIPGSPKDSAISIYGDTMYAGDVFGNADVITICPLSNLTACTTTNGGGTFSGPIKVYRLLP